MLHHDFTDWLKEQLRKAWEAAKRAARRIGNKVNWNS